MTTKKRFREMIRKIINFCGLKFILTICFTSTIQASTYCDLSEGIIREYDDQTLRSLPVIKRAFIATENCQFPPQFLDQTREMIKREAIFRHKCNVAQATNIAQLCIYGAYRGRPTWKFIETFDPKSCKGQFYLSGTGPIIFTQENKKPSSSLSTEIQIDTQKISHEKGYMQINQRLQPLLETIKHTVQYLEAIQEFVQNPSEEALTLAKQAHAKNQELNELLSNKINIMRELEQQARQLEGVKDSPDTLVHNTNKFMIGILRELITCLEGDDFYFYGMKDAVTNPNLKELITTIKKKLLQTITAKKKLFESSITESKSPETELSELLNSRNFNLGCSEPLVLFDLLNDSLDRRELITEIKKSLFDDQLETIFVQLHSTKTPCKSCLIACCGHLQNGVIKSFFEELNQEIKRFLKRENVNIRFLISYYEPYEDKYPFYIPTTSNLFNSSSFILLVNMQLYDEQYKKVKGRIVKQEQLRTEALLLRILSEKKGPLTHEDLKAAGLLT